jgi:hypothetical protein
MALRLIEEAAKMGREVTGLLVMNPSAPTLEESLGASPERAPALVDISVEANLERYRRLLDELR